MAVVDSTNPYLSGNGQQRQTYGAGKSAYGSGRPSPNVGQTRDMSGYRERDNKAAGMRSALLRRMQANQAGKFASSASMTPMRNLFPGPGGL